MAQQNAQIAIDLCKKAQDRVKAYMVAYGPILMPGESMEFQFAIPLKPD